MNAATGHGNGIPAGFVEIDDEYFIPAKKPPIPMKAFTNDVEAKEGLLQYI